MNNKIYIAAAGAGKTTFIINRACELIKNSDDWNKKVAIITYTIKNQENIKNRLIGRFGYIPAQLRIVGWYSFLLDYCIKPFMGSVIETLYGKQVGLHLVNGVSGQIITNGKSYKTYKSYELKKKFLTTDNKFYSDKLSEFAYKCYEKDKQDFILRLSNIFSELLFDEIQDISGWDYDIIRILLENSHIILTMCGDLRQRTYSTTDAPKNTPYKGHFDKYLEDVVNKGEKKYIEIDDLTLNKSHRFGKEIADFASTIMGDEFRATEPCNCNECMRRQEAFNGRKGVCMVRKSDVNSFISKYNPLVLIWNKRYDKKVSKHTCNYGDSKGLESDICLIYPTESITKFLLSDKNELEGGTRCKFYVAVTRARFLVGIVVDDNMKTTRRDLPIWDASY